MRELVSKTEMSRARALIDEVIQFLGLDLTGLVVLTEIGTGHYVYTPLIAALAGADQVVTVARDTWRGAFCDIARRGEFLAKAWRVRDRIRTTTTASPNIIAKADIVTNLGFLRPMDKEFISHMKSGAVIPYMREAWEYRPEDVDMTACRIKGVPVMGTNENYKDIGIFDLCGPLAAKMLFDAGLELKGNNIVVVSQNKFGDVISSYLHACGAIVTHARDPRQLNICNIDRIDAIIVASFGNHKPIVGRGGWVEPRDLAEFHPECTVVQFSGNSDIKALAKHRVRFVPDNEVGSGQMGQTLAYLGPKPVIALHAAGLKVGELMWRDMRALRDASQVEKRLSEENGLCQSMVDLQVKTE